MHHGTVKRIPAIIAAALLVPMLLWGQVRYSFSSSVGPYQPLGGSSAFSWNTTVPNDDEYSTPTALGFTFSYNGTSFTHLQASTNGFIRFGNDLTGSLPIDNLAGTTRNVVAPFWFDFKVGSTPADIRYQLSGSPGSRVFTVEWKNLFWDTTGVPYANFQVRLLESNGVIEFIYGGSNAPPSGERASGSIGLVDGTPVIASGQSTGTFLSINLGGSVGARVFHRSRSQAFLELTSLPDSNTVFRFTPAVASPLAGGTYTIGGIAPHFASLSDAADALNLNGIAGPVVLQIRTGTYDDIFHLVRVAGTSSVNTITVQRQSGQVTISPRNGSYVVATVTPSAGDAVIRLDGTSYVTIEGITIEGNGANTSAVTMFDAGVLVATSVVSTTAGTTITGSRFNTLKNLVINMNAVAGSVANPGAVGIRLATSSGIGSSDTSTANSYNVIRDVTIRGFYRSAIHMSGFSSTNPDRGNTITAVAGRNDIGMLKYFSGGGGNDIRVLEFAAQHNLTIERTDIHDVETTQFITNSIFGIILNPTGSNADAVGGTILIQDVKVYNLESQGPAVTTGMVKGLECNRTVDGTRLVIRNCAINDLFNNTYNARNLFNFTGRVEGVSINMAPVSGSAVLEFYNNTVYDLRAPRSEDASPPPAIRGLSLQSSTSTVVTASVFYNTIVLNDTAGVIPRVSSACVYWNTFPFSSLDLRNNIFVNTAAASGGGLAAVLWATDLTTLQRLAPTTNNNLYYAGAPSASRPVSYDGTTAYQTLAAHKAIVQSGGLGGPRDGASVTELPPFLSTTAPYDLRINQAIPTQIERGAAPIAGITTDHAGTPRNSVHPDIGAFEGDYTVWDGSGPTITFRPLPNTTVTQNRVLSNVTITDISDVDVVDFKPRLYYKRASDSNVFGGNTSTDNGWKWSETNEAASPFSFVFDFSRLYNGPPVLGDVIQYFVVAQDQAGTPHVSANPSAGFSASSVMQILSAPVSPASFTIASSVSGLFSVGSGGEYPSLTGAGGLFEILNSAVVVGHIIVDITSNLTEDGTNALNQWVEEGAGGYTLTVRSSEPVERLIVGSAPSGLIRFNGAARVTLDGRVGGSGKFLRIRNTHSSGATIMFVNDATYNTVTHCIIEGAVSSASNGVIFFGSGNSTGNSYNTISNCDIRDRSDTAGRPVNGIYSFATSSPSLFNRRNNILNNNIYNFHLDGGTSSGIRLDDGNTEWIISGNSIYQQQVRTFGGASTRYGIFVNYPAGNGFTIASNYIGGRGPQASGQRDSLVGAAALLYYPIRVSVGNSVPTTIQGNIIANTSFQTAVTAQQQLLFSAIYVSAGVVNIGTVTGNVIGSDNSSGSILLILNGSANNSTAEGISFRGSSGSIQNNMIGSITISGSKTLPGSFVGIGISSNVSASMSVSLNTVGSPTLANSIIQTTTTNPILQLIGIANSGSGPTSITGNIVANMTNSGSSSSSGVRGITHDGTGEVVITSNVIGSLSSASTNSATDGTNAVVGILCFPPAPARATINGNTISTLISSNAGTVSKVVSGISIRNTSSAFVGRNRIYDLRNLSTGSSSSVAAGIHIYSIVNNTQVSNNMISLGVGQATNTQFVGIWNNNSSSGILALYYNSVVVSDTAKSGSNPTYAFYRGLNVGSTDVTTPVVARNNAWINRRVNQSPATGRHVALGNRASLNPAAGWNSEASNYNAFYSVNDTVAVWGTTPLRFEGFQTASGGELNSVTDNPPFVDVGTGNLRVLATAPTHLESGGVPVAELTTDFDEEVRNSSTPDIGADEVVGTPSIKTLTLTVLVEGLAFPSSSGSLGAGERPLPFASAVDNDEDVLSRRIAYGRALQERSELLATLSTLGGITIRDTITVILRLATSPYAPIDTAKAFSSDSGKVVLSFTRALNNIPYYLIVRHRNSLDTWSAVPQTIFNGKVSYDFTTAVSKAFGNNLKLKNGKYCLYSGDVNRDGAVDISDLIGVDNAVTSLTVGYVPADVNGDGVVDGSDVSLVENNSIQYVIVKKPAGAQ
jgi:hypothetical protein